MSSMKKLTIKMEQIIILIGKWNVVWTGLAASPAVKEKHFGIQQTRFFFISQLANEIFYDV